MLAVYSQNCLIACLSPVTLVQLPLLNNLWSLLNRQALFVGDALAQDPNQLLVMQKIIDLHPGAFELPCDYALLQRLFFDSPSQIEELNRYRPCEKALEPRPFLDKDKSELERRIVRHSSGDWFADRLAELTVTLESFEQAQTIAATLTASEVDNFLFRLQELRRPMQELLDEQAAIEFAKAEQDKEVGDWIKQALLQGTG